MNTGGRRPTSLTLTLVGEVAVLAQLMQGLTLSVHLAGTEVHHSTGGRPSRWGEMEATQAEVDLATVTQIEDPDA